MGKRDGTSRHDLRRRLRDQERDIAAMTARLEETTRELIRCGWWQETGRKPPSWLQAKLNALWVKLVHWNH